MAVCGWETRDMFDRYNIIVAPDGAAGVGKRFNGKQAANTGAPVPEPGSLGSSPAISAA
jgi:hypothetical protein